MFRRSDQRDDPRDDGASDARNAATQGFLALDDEQRAAADAVHAADQLGIGRRLSASWASVSALGDAATEAYLAATQAPLDATDRTAGARAANERALAQIERARAEIRRYRADHARALDEAAHLLTGLPGAETEARTALVAAQAAVAAADRAGVRSRRAQERLAEAADLAAHLDGTDAGLRDRWQRAHRVADLAHQASTLAADAPRTAQAVRTALASIAIRREAAATKAGRIEPALSALRREFSEPCSHDLVDAERATLAAIATADTALAAAHHDAEAGDWDGAADRVAAARAALTDAEERHNAVTDRLAELRSVRSDPGRPAADARFVLRDAQRLVVARGLVARFGPVLDAQAVRLDNARGRLDAVHPDYWLYLTELRGIAERVKRVVADARHS